MTHPRKLDRDIPDRAAALWNVRRRLDDRAETAAAAADRTVAARHVAARDGIHPIDAFVGGRIRLRRGLLGLSQQNVAERLGVTFQQLQKYERGDNRVSASRLWQLGCILDVPVSFFFDGAQAGDQAPPAEAPEDFTRQELILLAHLRAIACPIVRQRLAQLAAALAAGAGAVHAGAAADA